MTQALFYQQPRAISYQRHGQISLKRPKGDYGFAAETNSVLLAGVEFTEVAKEYPIVFSRRDDGSYVPVVLLGLRKGENLFVDDEGQWRGTYVPAFIRRYPFIVARREDSMTVCLDEAYSGFDDPDGEPLFDNNGDQSALLSDAVDFLTAYQRQYQRTEVFSHRLAELDLFTELTARVDLVDGRRFALGGLQVIDEKKLQALEDEDALNLLHRGELAWVYAHLLSLGNLSRLVRQMSVAGSREDAA